MFAKKKMCDIIDMKIKRKWLNDMIRLILCGIFLLLFFIVSLPIFLVEFIIGKFNRHARDISVLRIVQWAFKVILFISGTRTEIVGFENIPKDEPVLFAGNHRSYFDVVIAYSLMPNLTGFVAKKEIGKVPIISTWMRLLYCLFLDRDDIKEGLKTILLGIDYVKSGISVVIFPEGTRAKEGEPMGTFKEGSLKIAEKSGCKIIPVVQNNTAQCMENNHGRIRSAHTTIEFCKPIDLKELSKEERKFAGAYIRQIIDDRYEINRQKYKY